MFGTIDSKKARNDKLNNSFAGRVRTTKSYHKRVIAPITPLDTLNGKDLEAIWRKQKGLCICCGKKFDSLKEAEIDHISGSFFFRRDNIQLICHDDNLMKRGLTLPFAEIRRQYGMNFLQLVRRKPQVVQDMLRCDDRRMNSIIRWAEKKG